MTQQEAIDAIDKTIFNKPSGIPDDQLRVLVTEEIANHLVDYWNATVYVEAPFMLHKESGDVFYYKGIECKVI